MSNHQLKIKRAYEPAAREDGYRILVDGIWPRGVSRDDLGADVWARDVAPSRELRRWFRHDPGRWDEFRRRYFVELEEVPDAVEAIRRRLREGTVTLVYGARDEHHNQAVALKQFLEGRTG